MWIWLFITLLFAFGLMIGCLVLCFRLERGTSGKWLLSSCVFGFTFVGYLVARFSGLVWVLLFGWICCSVW